MRSKKRKVFIAALFFIFVFDGGNVFAEDVQLPNDSETENFDNTDGQTDSDTVNIQDEISKANKIKQPFTWTSAGDVLKYEIIIKKKDEATGNYLPYFTQRRRLYLRQICSPHPGPQPIDLRHVHHLSQHP